MWLPHEAVGSSDLLINPPSPSTNGKFHPPKSDIRVTLSRRVSLSLLTTLVHEITKALEPIDNLNTMVYFKLHHSSWFAAYMKCVLKDLNTEPAVSLSTLGKAVVETRGVLQRVLQGSAKYKELTADGELALRELDIDNEFEVLVHCPQIGSHGTSGLLGIKCLVKLMKFTSDIEVIFQVCQQYHLNKCLEDTNLKWLVNLAKRVDTESELDNITPSEAKELWRRVCTDLCIEDEAKMTALELFAKVADSVDFYHFLEEKELTGKGEVAFLPQFQLITAQLQHAEYDQTVLNHLYAAFKFILPFMNSEHSLQSLMLEITSLDLVEGVSQLETVKKNMDLIRLWFSRAEVSTLS